MERTVAEKSMGLMSSPFALGSQRLYGSYYSGDAGAGFWQHHRPPLSSPSRMRMGMFAFTAAQWQELQRQALIYKHIVASVPVPHDLVHPSGPPTIFLPPPPSAPQAVFVVNGGGGGVEEGRCRRTDGKKWRCGREAAPEQKYCERHLNRGRPRSRKHVEHRRGTNTSRCKAASQVPYHPPPPPAAVVKRGSPAGDLMPDIGLNLPFHSMESSHEPSIMGSRNRTLDLSHVREADYRSEEWMKSYQENQASCGQWEAMRQLEELPNLNYTDTNESWCPFLNANLPSVHNTIGGDSSEPPRRFIDAWSRENTTPTANKYLDGSSASGRNKLPLPALTLSMSCADEDGADNGAKSQLLNWLAPELAEALHSSTKTSPRNSRDSADLINLMCNYGPPGSHEASPRDSPTRLISSPSGVLHKALVSLSDSSSSSSPTFATASRSDIAFQWMNLHK